MLQGFPRVTKGYEELPQVIAGYRGYQRLLQDPTLSFLLKKTQLFLLASFFLLHMLGSFPQTPVFPILFSKKFLTKWELFTQAAGMFFVVTA